jgi:hypothetical protein
MIFHETVAFEPAEPVSLVEQNHLRGFHVDHGRILNFYSPRTFLRSILPDAGMTTPRQIA